MSPIIEDLNKKIDALEAEIEQGNVEDIAEKVYALEEEIIDYKQSEEVENERLYDKIDKRISLIKKEFDLFDPELENDRIYPNRHDKDFDHDSTHFNIEHED